MYRVIKGFFDMQDDNHWYDKGDVYPREGSWPTESRFAELAGAKNRQQTALIEEVIEPAKEPVKREKRKKD